MAVSGLVAAADLEVRKVLGFEGGLAGGLEVMSPENSTLLVAEKAGQSDLHLDLWLVLGAEVSRQASNLARPADDAIMIQRKILCSRGSN
jgi:hypothetical protein